MCSSVSALNLNRVDPCAVFLKRGGLAGSVTHTPDIRVMLSGWRVAARCRRSDSMAALYQSVCFVVAKHINYDFTTDAVRSHSSDPAVDNQEQRRWKLHRAV